MEKQPPDARLLLILSVCLFESSAESICRRPFKPQSKLTLENPKESQIPIRYETSDDSLFDRTGSDFNSIIFAVVVLFSNASSSIVKNKPHGGAADSSVTYDANVRWHLMKSNKCATSCRVNGMLSADFNWFFVFKSIDSNGIPELGTEPLRQLWPLNWLNL